MGSIEERKHPSGNITWRVRLRRKDIPTFCITFDSLEEAANWMVNNEEEYYHDPDKYIHWREEIYHKMNRIHTRILDHVRKPHKRIKNEK